MEKIMTPMQELIDRLNNENEKYIRQAKEESSMQILGYAFKIQDCIKHAESMLEKEKEVMCEFGLYCTSNGSLNEIDYVFNETFKTTEK